VNRVIVKGEGSAVASVKLRNRCHSELILSYSRARSAIEAEAEFILERPVVLEGMERRSSIRFTGWVEWTQPKPGLEICSMELLAYMYPDGEISVGHRNRACEPS
jgi:hypothetical protein